LWVIISAATAIALGTFFGGWRIVKTMAFRLTSLKPYQGFCAETGGGAILTSMAWPGIPVSTTHAISGAIMGVGATKRLSAVRWGLGKRIVYAWVITIPASAAIAAAALWVIRALSG
jgi:PiT family inorganic phosphate transporter